MKRIAVATMLIAALLLCGCESREEAELRKRQADTAASIFEWAEALNLGLNPSIGAEAIKLQAAALVRTLGFSYERSDHYLDQKGNQ